VKQIIDTPDTDKAAAVKTLMVDEEYAGQRLDNFLLRHLKGVPKTHVYRIIRTGEVRINKGRVNADTRVQTGDMVRLPPVRVATVDVNTPVAPGREFPVLMEDEQMMAIDKPAGVAVHGGSGVSFGVIEQLRQARPGARMLELVHRLDRDTSGVLLIAKKRSALTRLQDQFRDRETGNTYMALVKGQWPSNKKVIDLPLQRYLIPNGVGEGERRVRIAAKDDANAQRAITLVRVSRLVGDYSLLEVTIKTGRTHQIRVHLASQGYPIVGDDKYGDFELNKRLAAQGMKRMFLHAWRLQFVHPQTGRSETVEAVLPEELQNFVDHVQPPPLAPV
jgi:23S rRNA pseudouridine955/2504/2580 synthase